MGDFNQTRVSPRIFAVAEAYSQYVILVRLLQTRSALEASNEQLNLYRELDRVVVQYVAQETALRSEGIDAKGRLAAEEHTSLSLENSLATQKEQMNYLPGRDIRTEFSVERPRSSWVLLSRRLGPHRGHRRGQAPNLARRDVPDFSFSMS